MYAIQLHKSGGQDFLVILHCPSILHILTVNQHWLQPSLLKGVRQPYLWDSCRTTGRCFN